MQFNNGILDVADQVNLKHQGSAYTPRMICMHYTVTDTAKAAINALNSRGLAYHFLVDHDGSITQTRKPDLHAPHAGNSNWKVQSGLDNRASINRSAVSISFINRGFFARISGDVAFDTNAHGDPVGKMYPKSEVTRTGSIYNPTGLRNWHNYTAAQVAAAQELILALQEAHPTITDLVGHDDVSIDGKFDTGPLWPMQQVRDDTGLAGGLGFETTVDSPDGELNMRQRPTGNSKKLATLRQGDRVFVRSVVYGGPKKAIRIDKKRSRYLTRWASVDVDGSNTHSGFVHMKFLADTPLTSDFENRL